MLPFLEAYLLKLNVLSLYMHCIAESDVLYLIYAGHAFTVLVLAGYALLKIWCTMLYAGYAFKEIWYLVDFLL